MRLITWDEGRTTNEVRQRYKNAQDARVPFENRWMQNERTVFSNSLSSYESLNGVLQGVFENGMPGVDGSMADVNTAYAFKNFRFIHAQMSANPPSVVMRPNSSDQEDRRRADAADRVVRWAIRKYQMQEQVDQLSLHCLLYGTGFVKSVWDPTKGAILEFNEETGEIKMEGDIDISTPFVWNIFIDPDARRWCDVKFIIERIYMDYDEALATWPDKEEALKKARVEKESIGGREQSTLLANQKYNCVELLEYWERGLPTNGYLGRYCITTSDGEPLEKCRANPFRFTSSGAVAKIDADQSLSDEEKEKKIARLPQCAELPYHILTDIDVPNTPWGRSFVEYVSGLQDNLNRLDTAQLDGIQAHGTPKMIVPDTADVEDNMSNSPWDIIKISGNQPPYFMKAPEAMPDMTAARMNYIVGINEVSGVNESMFGNQSREQSGASMQYATNQGNMIRRRLFNKYVGAVESIYKALLNLARKHWTTERTIHVLGKENALEAVDLKGADIDGGYDIVGEYGVSLSLDPMTRREEIMMLQPLFKEAGIPTRTSLRMLKLNELEGMFDRLQLAENRQKEIFDYMIARKEMIEPQRYMDHENMIAYALDWFMTSEFNMLEHDLQELCRAHIDLRIELAAKEKAAMTGPQQQVSQPPMAPGPLPTEAAGPLPPPAGQPAPAPMGA